MFTTTHKRILTLLTGIMIYLMHSSAHALATLLNNCFGAPQDYSITYDHDLEASENTANHDFVVPEHLPGSGANMVANCDCPKNISESTQVMELSLAGSPLNAGVSGYGYLTDKIDIDVDGYSDAVNSPDGSGLSQLRIDSYPTPLSSMSKQVESIKTTEGNESVCSDETRPEGTPPPKREFRWSTIGVTFYIKNPILGVEIIPSTLVAKNYACLYFGSGSCDAGHAQQVSNIWLGGALSVPLSCTINEGSTIEVDFGNIVSKQFQTKGVPPTSYTLKNVDISYHCDNNAVGNSDRIKLTLSADQGVVDSSDPLIGKMLDEEDIGVRIFDENNQGVALDGTFEFPVPMDDQGNGSIRVKAAPVSTVNATPQPGKFEGNVTVKMDLR